MGLPMDRRCRQEDKTLFPPFPRMEQGLGVLGIDARVRECLRDCLAESSHSYRFMNLPPRPAPEVKDLPELAQGVVSEPMWNPKS